MENYQIPASGSNPISVIYHSTTTPPSTGIYFSGYYGFGIKTFNDLYEKIEPIVEHKRGKWTFKATNMEDFDDVKMQILNHIYVKWHTYDQTKPVENWAATIVKNQFINKLRDCYQGTASPCNRCPCNVGNGQCSEFGEQGPICPPYNVWYFGKRHKHEAKMPFSMENHVAEVSSKPDDSIDIEKAALSIHIKIRKKLTISEWQIYEQLYVLNKTEEEAAAALGLNTKDKLKNNRIRIVKKIVLKHAKKILMEEGLEG